MAPMGCSMEKPECSANTLRCVIMTLTWGVLHLTPQGGVVLAQPFNIQNWCHHDTLVFKVHITLSIDLS